MLCDQVLTVRDVMERCQVSRDTVYVWMKGSYRNGRLVKRKLKYMRLGRAIRIRPEWLEEFLTPTSPEPSEQPRPSEALRIAEGLGLRG